MLFQGGVPTDPEVRMLLETFKEIEPEQVIPYETLEELLKLSKDETRFVTILRNFRRRVKRERNYILTAVKGTGLARLTEKQRSDSNVHGFVRAQRQAGRKMTDMHMVVADKLTEAERKTHDHRTRVLTAHMEFARQSVKQIAPPEPAKALPRGEKP